MKNDLDKIAREIDVLKVIGNLKNEFEISSALVKAQQEIIEALHIMKSTVDNFDDYECLQLNKERMIKYFNKFAKDEILSE
jgi:predicted XRE-type DNA-binding protein